MPPSSATLDAMKTRTRDFKRRKCNSRCASCREERENNAYRYGSGATSRRKMTSTASIWLPLSEPLCDAAKALQWHGHEEWHACQRPHETSPRDAVRYST